MSKTLTIKRFNQEVPPLDDIKLISSQCNWWSVSDNDYNSLFQGSFLTVMAYDNDEPVGTGRIISDGVVYGILVDILVIPTKQRQGIGKALMKDMLQYCKEKDLKMVKLLATPKGKGLYEHFGFKIRSESEPGMILFVKDINPEQLMN